MYLHTFHSNLPASDAIKIPSPALAMSTRYRNPTTAKSHHARQNTNGVLIIWLLWAILPPSYAQYIWPLYRTSIFPSMALGWIRSAASYRQQVVITQFSALLWTPHEQNPIITSFPQWKALWPCREMDSRHAALLSLQKGFVLITFL